MSAETESPVTIPAKIATEMGSFEPAWRSVVWKDWMVVRVVRYEPVSDCNSLIRAVLQGIFHKIRTFAQKCSLIAQPFQTLLGEIPREASSEFF